MQDPSPFAPGDQPESGLRRRSHLRCCQSTYALMPGRSSGTFSTGYARTSNVRRSKSPVARVARQLAYSPLVAISLTSTVMRRSPSAGIRTSKRSPSFSVLTRSSRRSKWIHTSLRSTNVTSGTPGETQRNVELGEYGAVASGRRRARRLSGRCLSGAGGGRSASRLGCRNFDRRYQFGDYRRQSAEAAGGRAARVLAGGLNLATRHTLFSRHQVRRHPAPGGQPAARYGHSLVRRTEFLRATLAAAGRLATGQSRQSELLRQHATARDAGATDRFRPHQCRRDAL